MPASENVKPVFAAEVDSPPAKVWLSTAICWVIWVSVTSPLPLASAITWT